MQIKIPKTPVVVLTVIVLLIGAFLTGQKFFSQQQILVTNKPIVTSPIKKDSLREIQVTAKQFEFIPNTIKVKLGEKVRLRIKSIDVAHGFNIAEFNINETLEPGKEVVVEFQATKKGEFSYLCSVFCGSGHSSMRGKLIVE